MPVASTFGATGALAIDVSGGNQTLPRTCRAFWVGTGGNLAVVFDDGSEAVIPNIQDGSIVDFQAIAVKKTGTTASGVFALF